MKLLQILVLLLASSCGFAQTYAILADRLIDGKSDHAFPNPTIIVRQDKIIAVNFTRTIPDSAIVIDLKGHTLLPGLMDVHTHLLGINAASLLRVQNSLGQIQKGFIADIIAVRGNPLEDITLLQHVDFVMKAGKVIKQPL